MLTFLLIFDTLFTIVLLSWQSLFPEKFPDIKDRNYVAAITQTIRLLGSVIALMIPPIFITYGDIYSYRKPVLILSGITLVGFLISLYGSQDKEIMLEREEKEVLEGKEKEKIPYFKAIGRVLNNKNLIAYALALGFSNIAFLILMAMMRYMNKWVLVQDPIFETAFNAVAFGVGITTFIFWIRVSIKKGPKFVYLICGTMFAVALFPLLFANENWAWITLIVMFFVGLSLSGLLLVPDLLISEVIDDDKERSGENREGLVYGFFGFTSRIAIVIESYLITFVLSRTGFDATLPAQSASAKMGIKFLLAGIPLICFLCGNLLMIFLYDLSRKRIEKRDGKKLSIFY
jgi:GPH family glycoside/pentoside/hexuronide:cation symporter